MPLAIYNKRLNDIGPKALQYTSALIAFWDKDLICRFANRAYLYWFGAKPEEMIDKMHIQDLLGPLYEKNLKYINGALSGKVQVFERMIPTPDGLLRNTRAIYTPEINDGKVLGFYVCVTDIDPIGTDSDITIPAGPANTSSKNDEVMYEVEQELKKNLQNCFPGLCALAKQHRVSESKLKRDFKQKHGLSVFSFYRKLQMELAEKYIKEKLYTKGQLAIMFNFSNPSNFSSCYQRHILQKESAPTSVSFQNTSLDEDAEILRRASEISKIGTWTRNFENGTAIWSKISREILELPPDFVPDLEKVMCLYKKGKSRAQAEKILKAMMETGQAFDTQVEMITGKGNIKLIRVIGFPEFNDGKCKRVSGTFQEIIKNENGKNSLLQV
eukprot:TRINITY_DN94820_c0_g1_i1.p1 TRINITY_DN94820_c0_g1~~TRINITY_DN94820_c0_g1_i1.p1  ORF type:complete len:385 (-),score=39.80 TRINITY_DN94820_c0_g1_i1:256-1410(-)